MIYRSIELLVHLTFGFLVILQLVKEEFRRKPETKTPPAMGKDVEKYKDDSGDTAEDLDVNPFAAKTFSEKTFLIFAICFGDFMQIWWVICFRSLNLNLIGKYVLQGVLI